MNFYLSAIDDLLRHPDDKPTIGLILCKRKNQLVAEYALRDMSKPLGISVFHYLEALPENLKGTLPTIQELEAELGKGERQSGKLGMNKASHYLIGFKTEMLRCMCIN